MMESSLIEKLYLINTEGIVSLMATSKFVFDLYFDLASPQDISNSTSHMAKSKVTLLLPCQWINRLRHGLCDETLNTEVSLGIFCGEC